MISLTNGQERAKKKITEWILDESPDKKKTFVLSGLAGTGKTTLLKEVMMELNLIQDTRFVAFTGKAALVLNQKGLPATTIHQLIYELEDDGEEDSDGFSFLKGKNNLVFRKRDYLPKTIKLLVCDEGSMLNQEMYSDLLSFEIPLLICGDPRQLPPITGDIGIFDECDAELTEIVRQESDNPIILLAHDILAEGRIVPKYWGKNIKIHIAEEIKESSLKNADQVLCYKNETRRGLNERIRASLSFSGNFPSRGEKLICLKNNREVAIDDIPLVNGCIGYAESSAVFSEKSFQDTYSFELLFRPDYTQRSEIIRICREPFEEIKFFDKFDKELNFFDFGYAITVHKAQGSEFSKVLICDDLPRRIVPEEDCVKWLYTAVTRAKDALIYYR